MCDCQMTDLCSKCYHSIKTEKRKLLNGVTGQSTAVIPTVKKDKIMSISLKTTNSVPVSQQHPGMTVTVEVGESTENRNNTVMSIEPICNDCGSQFHIIQHHNI